MMSARLLTAMFLALFVHVAPTTAAAATLPAGAIDPTFGVSGRAQLPDGFAARGVLERVDGTTLVVGTSNEELHSVILDASGVVVPGSERVTHAGLAWFSVTDVIPAASLDGVYVLGNLKSSGGKLVKLDANGVAVSGFAAEAAMSGLRDASSLALAGDGSLLVGGSVPGSADWPVWGAIRRLDGTTGQAIQSWGSSGQVVNSDAHTAWGALTVDGSQRVLAAVEGTLLLQRYLSDGSLDTSFGQGGSISNGASGFNVRALHVIGSGSIIIVGSTQWHSYKSGWAYGWASVLDATGKRIGGREFGSGSGRFESFIPGDSVSPTLRGSMGGFVTTGPGRIVAWGSTGQNGDLRRVPVTVAFTQEGSVDASYAEAGLAISNQVRWQEAPVSADAVPVLIDGGVTRIAIAGPADMTRPRLVLSRPDVRFGNDSGSSRGAFGLQVVLSSAVRLTWTVRDVEGPALTEMGWRSANEQEAHTAITETGSRRFPLKQGEQVCVDLRARDAVGRASEWQTRCVVRPSSERAVRFGRGWGSLRRARYTNGVLRIAERSGLVARIDGTGSVESFLIVTKCPTCGSIVIRNKWGGQRLVSLKSRRTWERQRVSLGRNTDVVVTTRSRGRVMIDGVIHVNGTSVRPSYGG